MTVDGDLGLVVGVHDQFEIVYIIWSAQSSEAHLFSVTVIVKNATLELEKNEGKYQ